MNVSKDTNNLIQQVILLLKPMGKVNYLIKDGFIELKKDQNVFGKIINNKIYLLNDNQSFDQIENSILKSEDGFLKKATKSYWIASGKTISI